MNRRTAELPNRRTSYSPAWRSLGIAALTLVLRNKFIPMMDQLAPLIVAQKEAAIPAFRQIHTSAILINTCQLLAILGSLGMV